MSTPQGTLRAELDERRERGERFSMRQIVSLMVPLISDLDDLHKAGKKLFVHPSAIAYEPGGATIIEEAAAELPSDPFDRACIAPEERQGEGGDARSSVFAVGAILYELATGKHIGPGMRRPSEVAKGVSHQFEALLAKSLVSDRSARPADLAALAQALHHCAPMASMPPPAADESHLDHDGDFEVDISLSMIPPAKPGAVVIPAAPALPSFDPLSSRDAPASGIDPASSKGSTAQLADLKTALESDPRPRYIVIKDGMDHGPFTAVELLQQIATGSFRSEHFLRDALSQEEKQIADWEEFAPFAEHARRGRAVAVERKALDATVAKEKQSTQNKAFIGGAVLVLVAAGATGWWFKIRKSDDVRMGVSGDEAQFIDFDTGLGEGKKGPVAGGTWKGGNVSSASDSSGVSRPQLGGGMSCEGARAAYVENYDKSAPPDLSAGAYGAVLNRGSYLNSCGVPPSMSVSICAAVQNGRAVGVSVRTDPPNGGIAGCISGAVRGMGFPAHPRLDITTTHFAAE
jgi:eukaryotic-like serine/threonine-protein kinase